MNRQERTDRLKEKARKAKEMGDSLLASARKMGEAIPFGQPILIGHHSEGRDRRFRARINSRYSKGFQALERADHYASRAAAAENNTAIYGSDPDAVSSLKAKIAQAEKDQESMKKANALIRKGDHAGLITLFGETGAKALLTPNCFGGVGYPSYALTNNNANIRRMKERLTSLEVTKATDESTEIRDGVTIERDPEAYRIRLLFGYKPDQTVRARLKSLGFRWSPSESAWQRHLNQAGERAVQDFFSK